MKNIIFVEKTFADCSLLSRQRMPCQQISQRKLSRTPTKPWNSRKFSAIQYQYCGQVDCNIRTVGRRGFQLFFPHTSPSSFPYQPYPPSSIRLSFYSEWHQKQSQNILYNTVDMTQLKKLQITLCCLFQTRHTTLALVVSTILQLVVCACAHNSCESEATYI